MSPTSITVPASGGTVKIAVRVTAGTNCSFTISSPDAELQFGGGTSFSGSGDLSFNIAANPGAERSFVLTIAGTQVTITQKTINCVTSLSPTSVNYPAETRTGLITVTAPSDCAWTAVSQSPFLRTTPPYSTTNASGTGNGSFRYYVDGNITDSPRSGTIQVAQLSASVSQDARTNQPFLQYVSENGDYIGGGQTLLLQVPTSTITATIDASLNHVDLRTEGSNGLSTEWWSLDFAAPKGQRLGPGTYTNATRYPFQAATVPGLNVSGSGRGCNTLSGQFVILQADYSGTTVVRFHATFEQHCEGQGPALRGEILFYR